MLGFIILIEEEPLDSRENGDGNHIIITGQAAITRKKQK